jgi:hypothetical protein
VSAGNLTHNCFQLRGLLRGQRRVDPPLLSRTCGMSPELLCAREEPNHSVIWLNGWAPLRTRGALPFSHLAECYIHDPAECQFVVDVASPLRLA